MASYLFYDAYNSGALQTAVQTGNSNQLSTGWDTRRENAGQYSPQINRERQTRNTFTSTTPTTTNGNFGYTTDPGVVQPEQGFITPAFDALNLPSGQWTINQEIRTSSSSGNSAGRFVYFLFKVPSPATSSGTFSATAIPMYSDAALTTQISGPVQSSVATSIGTTAQKCSTTFCTDRNFLDIEHFYLQVWWEITTRNNNRNSAEIYYANGSSSTGTSLTYTNDPFNIESPDFRRKRFVIS